MDRLEGKVALVTGAKGGLGTYVTNAMLDAGATVVGVSRSIKGSDFDNPNFVAMPAEVSSAANARQLAESVVSKFGRIDSVVHLMGGFAGGIRVADTDCATLDRMMDLNFRSAFHLLRAVLPQMRNQRYGRIVAIGSRAAVDGNAGAGAYSASKAALIALMRAVALENKDVCISANVVLPGTMDTPGNREAMPGADYTKWVQPAQVARLIVSLTSDEAPQMTGAVLPIYGGEL
jgi:NAD(P)-dependent dehydrogenase (short-subunit alcohol dehydrogenase family)